MRQITYAVQPYQDLYCKCGKKANCFITDHGWICIDCYNKAVHRAVEYIA